MGRKCSAKPLPKGFTLLDKQIEAIYLSEVKEWSNGGAYIPIPSGHGKKGVYVVVRK